MGVSLITYIPKNTVSKMLDTNTIFTGLITQEDFIARQLEIVVSFVRSSNSYNAGNPLTVSEKNELIKRGYASHAMI
jgi:hypothetical protein